MIEIKRVVSVFDGIIIAQQALNNVGMKPEKYFAAEIDTYARQITTKNFTKSNR